jgi:hypothetical protein
VAFELINNHIIVPVSINGSNPLRFVLDSGAAATVIVDSHRSRLLALRRSGALELAGAGSGFVSRANIVAGTRVSVGSLSLLDQSVISIPLEAIPFFDELDEVYFDGIIGYDFLRRFAVEINYDQMQVVIAESDNYQSPFESPADDWQTLALEVSGGMPFLTTQVSTAPGETIGVKLLVDTGSTGSFSLIASSIDGVALPGEYYVTTSQGLTGDILSRVTQFDFLAVGTYRLYDIPGSYSVSGEKSESGSNGILGNRAMSRFNLVFDYPNGCLSVQANDRFHLPMRSDRSGLRVLPHSRGGIVKSVAAGTAGEAVGLQVGDIITRFDDEPVTRQTISQLQRTLASPADAVRLCWTSGEEHRCERLELASRYLAPSNPARRLHADWEDGHLAQTQVKKTPNHPVFDPQAR